MTNPHLTHSILSHSAATSIISTFQPPPLLLLELPPDPNYFALLRQPLTILSTKASPRTKKTSNGKYRLFLTLPRPSHCSSAPSCASDLFAVVLPPSSSPYNLLFIVPRLPYTPPHLAATTSTTPTAPTLSLHIRASATPLIIFPAVFDTLPPRAGPLALLSHGLAAFANPLPPLPVCATRSTVTLLVLRLYTRASTSVHLNPYTPRTPSAARVLHRCCTVPATAFLATVKHAPTPPTPLRVRSEPNELAEQSSGRLCDLTSAPPTN